MKLHPSLSISRLYLPAYPLASPSPLDSLIFGLLSNLVPYFINGQKADRSGETTERWRGILESQEEKAAHMWTG